MKTIFTFALIFSTFYQNPTIEAHCAKCTKIEAERAEQQALNPQPAGYYDDIVKPEAHSHPANSSRNSSANANQSQQLASKRKTTNEDEEVALIETPEKNPLLNSRFEPTDDNFNPGHAKDYSTLFNIFDTKDFLTALGGSFTLFIPTNDAFRHLKGFSMQDLLKPDNDDKLSQITSYHVVAKQLLNRDFTTGLEVKTIGGRNLKLKAEAGKLSVNGAQVLRIEPAGRQGIIYIIDKVLIPQADTSLAFNDDLSNPGISEENRVDAQAKAKLEAYTNEEQTMINNDKKLMQNDYDPNEGYGGFRDPKLNKPYSDQEKMIQGQKAAPSASL